MLVCMQPVAWEHKFDFHAGNTAEVVPAVLANDHFVFAVLVRLGLKKVKAAVEALLEIVQSPIVLVNRVLVVATAVIVYVVVIVPCQPAGTVIAALVLVVA